MTQRSCLYEGWVRHRRVWPVENELWYRLFMVYLDLAELDRVFRGRWLWSIQRWNVASFRREDHLGPPEVPLDEAVRRLVQERTGVRPAGPIRLLTHLRYFGHGFNPVSFYYCFDPEGEEVRTLVAEVNNTPWREQHCYVLDRKQDEHPRPDWMRFRFPKDFHVSPFLPMEIEYDWRFRRPGPALSVHLIDHHQGRRVFDATLSLRRSEMSARNLSRVLATYPLMTLKVIAAIHWQALRLWRKGAPFHVHPSKRPRTGGAAS